MFFMGIHATLPSNILAMATVLCNNTAYILDNSVYNNNCHVDKPKLLLPYNLYSSKLIEVA